MTRKDDLATLRASVVKEMEELGIQDTYVELPLPGLVKDIGSPNGYINAEDTWTGKVADSQNTDARADVFLLSSAFEDLLDDVTVQHRDAVD